LVTSTLLVYYSTKRSVPSVTNDEDTGRRLPIWSTKQRRAYHRIMSGYKFALFLGKRIRFMTLTTSNEGRDRDIGNDFKILVKRIKRKYGEFEYIRIKTSEGNGVLHVLFRGSYIPQRWLSVQWSDIHFSPVVDVRDTRRYHCSYVINQYLTGQSLFERYSSSLHWVFPGYVAKWEHFKFSFSRDEWIVHWDCYLRNVAYDKRFPQHYLDDFGFGP
jgi:hypothetical protein